MKTIVFQRVQLVIIVLFSIFFVSCQPEEVVEPETDLTGSWTCSETSGNPSSTSSFTVHIKKSGSGYTVENFYNLGFNHTANINVSNTSISIPSQNIAGFSVSGSGSIVSSAKITLNYQADDGSGSTIDNCTATLNRK